MGANRKSKRDNKNITKNKFTRDRDIVVDLSSIHQNKNSLFIINSIITALISITGVMAVVSSFAVNVSVWIVILTAIVTSVFLNYIAGSKKRCIIGAGIFILCIGILCLVFMNSISNGFSGILNDVLRTVNKNMAMANLLFVVNDATVQTDENIAVLFLTVAVTLFFMLLIRFRLNMLAVFTLVIMLTVGMMYKSDIAAVWVVCGIVSAFAVLYFGNIRGRTSRDMIISSVGFVALVMVITVAVFLLVGYSPIAIVDTTKNAIVYNGQNLIYGKSDYPEGDFERFTTLNMTGETKLHVEMDTPEVMYLRGYVGSKYTSQGWEANSQNVYGGDYEGIFEYFARFNYYPLCTAASYIDISREADSSFAAQTTVNVEITNVAASKKYEYVPENMTYSSLSNLYAAKKDVNFVAQGIGNSKPYSFQIDVVPNYDYEGIYNETWYKEGYGDSDFIDCEQSYAYFSNVNYIEIPDEIKSYFDSNLEYAGEKLNPFDAVGVIRQYLENNIEYDENVDAPDLSGDFVLSLLNNSKKGYSVHFATVAALMFRYYGIPARYVEGYLATPDEGETSFDLADNDAHAWVEIYVNGLGFIPIEVTPGFYTNESAGGSSSSGGGSSGNSGGSSNSDMDNNQENMKDDLPPVVTFERIIIVLAVIICICVLAVIIRRIIIIRKRDKILYGEDMEKVVALSGECMLRLMDFRHRKLEEQIEPEFKMLLERLKFGSAPPTHDEASIVRDNALVMIRNTYQTEKLKGKIILRYVLCLT